MAPSGNLSRPGQTKINKFSPTTTSHSITCYSAA
jgi:hypothetical protein